MSDPIFKLVPDSKSGLWRTKGKKFFLEIKNKGADMDRSAKVEFNVQLYGFKGKEGKADEFLPEVEELPQLKKTDKPKGLEYSMPNVAKGDQDFRFEVTIDKGGDWETVFVEYPFKKKN